MHIFLKSLLIEFYPNTEKFAQIEFLNSFRPDFFIVQGAAMIVAPVYVKYAPQHFGC
jgi:hypothetical protein